MLGNIHSIESMGTVDGPGIRFVVFMQGCPLRCKYCHNPDTWTTETNHLVSVETLYQQFASKKEFYKTGGITITGGEPLLQIDFLIELFKKFKAHHIHTCIDTSGIVFSPLHHEKIDELMQYTDLILLDLKHIDNKQHQLLTGKSNDNILAFAKYLDQKKIPVIIRHVVVDNITYIQEYLFSLGQFIGSLNNVQAIDVLPYHNLGIVKYQNLKIDYPLKDVKPTSKQAALAAKKIILAGIKSVK